MLVCHLSRAVAGQAQIISRLHQQVGVFRLMGLMARLTIAVAVRRMGIGVAARQLLVAAETGGRRALLEQAGIISSMRTVARQAGAATHRLMNPTLVTGSAGISVTGQAQILNRLLQQAGIARDMRAMTGQTIPLRRRLVIDLLAIITAVVTAETIDRQCHRTTEQQHNNCGTTRADYFHQVFHKFPFPS
jgi:hypothetical protein